MKNSLSTSDSTTAPSVGASSPAIAGTRPESKAQPARSSKSMTQRMLIMLVLMALFIVAIGAWKAWQIKTGIAMAAKFAPPPAAVTTAVAKTERWQPVLSAVGSLKAVNGVTVSTDLAGIISQIAFQSGAAVKKGDLLVRLDSSQEEAALHTAEARRDLAKLSLDRQKNLRSSGAVSQSDYDSADSEFRQDSGLVDAANALIARKTIVAPFDGILGIRQVDLGQYLDVGAPIVPLQSTDPIYVNFSLPQENLEQIAIGKKIHVKANGITGDQFEGNITAIDSRFDESTRNIMIQGTVPNAENRLRPGMFVNVEVIQPEQDVVSIPATSISYAPYGDSVFVVKDVQGADGKPVKQALQQFVKTGPTRGDQVSIISGVKAGDEVVSSGVFKLRSGIPIQVNNSVQPENEANPTPPNR
jgi:membrane fusion protein (multidrug efflux system)